jgi:uncharacterized damage-inducible protein DinB
MTADQALGLVEVLTETIEQESEATRKVIRAITNGDYKPDDKSRTAWELATHLALSEMWFVDSIAGGAFVWSGEPPIPPELTSPERLAQWHEEALTDGLKRLRAMTAEEWVRPLEFFGRRAPAATWLTFMNNHAVHHRGQLAAYLRPMGSKVPAIYGVSADSAPPA